MQNNDNVPMGVALAVLGFLGILIVGSFVFAGWSVVQLRRNASEAVLALGKTIAPPPEADPEYNDYEEFVSPYALTIEAHGEEITFAHAPVVYDYRTYVPIRGVFETLGYVVSWDEYTNVAMFHGGETTIIVTLDEYTFTANGEPHILDTPARLIDDIPMLPLEPIISTLGYNISFNQETNTLFIFERPAQLPPPRPEPEPTPTPTPSPAVTVRPPAPPPETVTCHTCEGARTVICTACNGIGGGRGTSPFVAGIPYATAPAADVWWCTACEGRGQVTCRTCTGTGLLTVGR